MEGAQLMGYRPEDLGNRLRIERRAIRGEPLEGKSARLQGGRQAPQKRFAVLMGRIVVEDSIAYPFVPPIVHRREHAVGPLVELIDRHVTRDILQRPVEARTIHVALCLFFPQPLPSFGSWHRARRRGGRARDASWRAGRAGCLRPPSAPPSG